MQIFVSMPCSNGLIHQKTIITLQTISQKHNIIFKFIENCALIQKARNEHFSMFARDNSFDYLLSVDADMILGPPGILDHMIEEGPKNSIIAGLYAMKALDSNGNAPLNGIPKNVNTFQLDGNFHEMLYLPTGFMLTPKSVALKMISEYKSTLEYNDNTIGTCYGVYNPMLLEENGKRQLLPEDFSYCKRARDIGIDLYADTAAMLGHIGQFMYHIEHLRR